jgi:hypothetical protein
VPREITPGSHETCKDVGESDRPCEENKGVELVWQAEVMDTAVEMHPTGDEQLSEKGPEQLRFPRHLKVMQLKDREGECEN